MFSMDTESKGKTEKVLYLYILFVRKLQKPENTLTFENSVHSDKPNNIFAIT